MKLSRSSRILLVICALQALVIAGCDDRAAEQPPEAHLSITSPQDSSSIPGGGELRIALSLLAQDDKPVEGALVQAELWHPSGELYASFPCEDRGHGSYVAELVKLPLRGSSGSWRITARATQPNGPQADIEGMFLAGPSVSEIYQERHGFWIEYPRIFGLGTGFHNLFGSGGLHFEDWLHDDGGGFVMLDNYRYVNIGVTFATLEIHWRGGDFPSDAGEAITYVENQSHSGLHHQHLEVPLMDLAAQETTFQGRAVWGVTGQGSKFNTSAGLYPIEWLIFECPASDWLWSLVIAADKVEYLDHLRSMRMTFVCPPVNLN